MAPGHPNTLISHIHSAQIAIGCTSLDASIQFLTSQLGFKVHMIMPSEAPKLAVLSGHGCTLRLDSTLGVTPIRLHISCDVTQINFVVPNILYGPDNMVVEVVDVNSAVVVPDGTQEFVITRMVGSESWGVGRAGMLYRDLIPSRLGGRFVASHIHIPQGGSVPDYVHYHRVRFQVIYCKAGWVRLVYEDQGEPFIMHAGDCVLQPPEIRHRVLEASDGLEVIEIGCPAIHETHGDTSMKLPTGKALPGRFYFEQKFVLHKQEEAHWGVSRLLGFEERDTGIACATNGLAGVRVLRNMCNGRTGGASTSHQAELVFFYVLKGQANLVSTTHGEHHLNTNDCCVLPSGGEYQFLGSAELEMLEVSLPAALQ